MNQKLIFKVPSSTTTIDKEMNMPIPRWGRVDSNTEALLVREEYVRIRDRLKSNPTLKFALLSGTKGIGKTLFIYYLIYDLVLEALKNQTSIPSFLLVYDNERRYILRMSDHGIPEVICDQGNFKADYLISDNICDTMTPVHKWNLHIHSLGSDEKITRFEDAVGNAGKNGAIFTMGVLPLEEMVLLSDNKTANFIHMVFGGSARHLKSIYTGRPASLPWYDMIRSALEEFIANSEFSNEDFKDLVDRSCEVLSNSFAFDYSLEYLIHSHLQHIFTHTVQKGDIEYPEFASGFMEYLVGRLIGKSNLFESAKTSLKEFEGRLITLGREEYNK